MTAQKRYIDYGLQTSSSWTRENSNNDFLYNEGSELNKTTGWYETPFRNYDAALGRLTSEWLSNVAASDDDTVNFLYTLLDCTSRQNGTIFKMEQKHFRIVKELLLAAIV